MKLKFLKEFNQSALIRFGTVAQKLDLKIKKLADGIFEINAASFSLRIRLGTGHRTNILVTMVENIDKSDDFNAFKGELGLGVIMEYYGTNLIDPSLTEGQDVDAEMARIANLSLKYCSPFLLNKSQDWKSIKDYINQKKINSGIYTKKWTFPKNVREEWL